MEKEYAQALARSLEQGTDEKKLVEGLIVHLKEAGRIKLLPGILRELKSLEARRKTLAPSIEVASEDDKAGALEGARQLGIDTDVVTVNPSLIRGWRARSGSTLVDRSAKHALADLYQRITH